MGDIKTRFSLEGEQQYRSAMTNAANAIRVLNSEQKLAAAQFKNTGDAEKYAADQARILQEKIKQQQQAVKAAQSAMKELADKGVAENSRQYQQWQTKLNNAQTALTQMETQLQSVNKTMQETTTTASETGDAVEAIGKNVSFDTVIKGIGNITDKMSAAAQKAKELAGELVSTMRDAAAWADDLATQATVYGIDTATLQRMRYTADLIDTSVEAIMKSRQKLINNMVYGNEEIQTSFQTLGVATQEFMGGKYGPVATGYRDWADVFWDAGAALAKMDDSERASAIATKLLGRSWEELKPLFVNDYAEKGYATARDYYNATMETWNVVTDENTAKLGELDDTIHRLENNFKTLKYNILGELAPAFTAVGNTASNLLTEFNKYLETDEGQKKLNDLSESVTTLFSGLTDVDFGDALTAAKGALDAVVGGLKWVSEHHGEVGFALKSLAIAFGGLKISETVLTFLQLLAAGKFLAGGTAATEAATAGAAAGSAWGGAFVKAAMAAAPWLAGALTLFTPGVTESDDIDALFDEASGKMTSAGWDDYYKAMQQIANGKEDPSGWSRTLMEAGNLFGVDNIPAIQASEDAINALAKYRTTGDQTQLIADMQALGFVLQQTAETVKEVTTTAKETAEEVAKEVTAAPAVTAGKTNTYRVADANGSTLELTADQARAIEDFWDIFRNSSIGDISDEEWDSKYAAFENAFSGNTFLQNIVDGLMTRLVQSTETSSELPEDFFKVTPTLTEESESKIQGELNGMSLTATVALLPTLAFGDTSVAHLANGIYSVPYDGYPAVLHKGERVMPAREANNYSSNLYVESMYMNNGTDAAGLAAAMAAAQRRTMAGYGS